MSLIDDIRARVDLAAVVESYGIALRRRGPRAVGCCPFHAEKTPSFTLYPEGTFHCFGCGAHGDVINFVSRIANLSTRDAMRRLAAGAGIRLSAEARPELPAAAPLLPDALPAEADLSWIRAARKTEFDRLVLRRAAVEQRIRLAVVQQGSDADWDRLAAYRQRDSVLAEISAFWEQPGFLPLDEFVVCSLEAAGPIGAGGIELPSDECAVHLLRPRRLPGKRDGAAEWLWWLQPPAAAVMRMVRNTMQGPISAAEVEQALRWRRQHDARFAPDVAGDARWHGGARPRAALGSVPHAGLEVSG